MSWLPKSITTVTIPPIKCQGIKSRLTPFILRNIAWSGRGRWIEPFLGSGVVLFNVQPERALINDINPHIITVYRAIAEGRMSPKDVGMYLRDEGQKLMKEGESYYYLVRDRFNRTADPFDFIFLNRSCFNGLMRFNANGEFNAPFCRKPDRFRPSYVTKIVRQVDRIQRIMRGKDWVFQVGDWRPCLAAATADDFVYLDPPYYGRHTAYYHRWTAHHATELASAAQRMPCGFAVSMWKANAYRVNAHLEHDWKGLVERTYQHVYFVGATVDHRHAITEALLIKPGFAAVIDGAPSPPHLGTIATEPR